MGKVIDLEIKCSVCDRELSRQPYASIRIGEVCFANYYEYGASGEANRWFVVDSIIDSLASSELGNSNERANQLRQLGSSAKGVSLSDKFKNKNSIITKRMIYADNILPVVGNYVKGFYKINEKISEINENNNLVKGDFALLWYYAIMAEKQLVLIEQENQDQSIKPHLAKFVKREKELLAEIRKMALDKKSKC